MTKQRSLKTLVRARMARTGESYLTARRALLLAAPAAGYPLRAGLHPETSALANALAARGVDDPSTGRPLSEALVLGIGGGLGAGYILWVWAEHDRRVVTTGFRNQWQYPDRWHRKVCERLGVPVTVHETSGSVGAAKRLRSTLDAGLPAVAWISAADLPYWHLPAEQSGWCGYPVTIYGQDGDRFLVDDRNQRPLTISAEALAAARGRIVSYKNRLLVPDAAATEVEQQTLVAAVEAGLAEQVEHLNAKSDSFSLPAFAKWARLMTDRKNAKAWSVVFADGVGLLEALVSSHLAVTPDGILGGNLRGLYADFLDGAARLTGRDLAKAAAGYRAAEQAWLAFGQVCLTAPGVAEVVAAERDRREAVARGDAGRPQAAAAGARSAELIASADVGLDQTGRLDLFERMAGALTAAHAVEVSALDGLRSAL